MPGGTDDPRVPRVLRHARPGERVVQGVVLEIHDPREPALVREGEAQDRFRALRGDIRVIGESNELVYICAYEDMAARERVCKSFMSDPEWLAARKTSEANGPLVERVVNKFWRPTSFSPIQ